jgi:squalene cyclase
VQDARPPIEGGFPTFTWQQTLDHFRYYHERSESIYNGDGNWKNLQYKVPHPLDRDSSRRAQGYMCAFTATQNPLYRERAKAALDWLLTDQKPDGHFTWWNTPAGTDNRIDCQYTTAEGGSALAEGYAFFGDPRYLAASARAAEWGEQCDVNIWNTNYVMFTAWHLAKHYRITGEQRWLDAAVRRVVECAIPRQAADGSWKEATGEFFLTA